MKNRKPRGDSKLDALTPEQHEQLCVWLTVDNLTYSAARKLVKARFGVTTTLSALSSFFGSSALPWKYAQDHAAAKEFAAMQQGDFQPAMLKRIEQLAFQLASSNRVDVKTLKSFVKMLTDSQKVSLQKQNLELAIEKFRDRMKSEVEKGLDAMHAEIKDNPKALELFEKLKACVLESVEAAKQ